LDYQDPKTDIRTKAMSARRTVRLFDQDQGSEFGISENRDKLKTIACENRGFEGGKRRERQSTRSCGRERRSGAGMESGSEKSFNAEVMRKGLALRGT